MTAYLEIAKKIMSNYVEIDKISSAQRHIDTATEMFFEGKDTLVVYSVAFTAYQMLSEICQQKGIPRPVEDNEILKELGVQKQAIEAFRKPRNFLQHGQRGSGTVKFFPAMGPFLILMASELCQKLGSPISRHTQILHIWFAFKYQGRSSPAVNEWVEKNQALFDPDDHSIFLDLLRSAKPQG